MPTTRCSPHRLLRGHQELLACCEPGGHHVDCGSECALPWLNTFDPYLAAAVHHAGLEDLGIRTGTGKLAERPSLRRTAAIVVNAPGYNPLSEISSTSVSVFGWPAPGLCSSSRSPDGAPEVVGQFDCTDLSSTGEPPEKLKWPREVAGAYILCSLRKYRTSGCLERPRRSGTADPIPAGFRMTPGIAACVSPLSHAR
jgi:hypothetical protein